MSDEKILLFNKWSNEGVQVDDAGLQNQINLKPIIVPRSNGKYGNVSFHKNDMHVVERFINRLGVSGHKGKKHKRTSGRMVGQNPTLYSAVKKAFEIIEKKTNKNPIQILVKAIENSALFEEVAAYRVGGSMARKSVITAPQRRLDVALRLLTQGIYSSSFKSPTGLPDVIANELISAANNDAKSHGVRERIRMEKEAEGAR